MEPQLTDKFLPIAELLKIIKTLRGKNGCAWDKQQTPKTMLIYLKEEVHELIDAINSEEPAAVLEELGDMLFLIFFITNLFEEAGHFNISQVAEENRKKMITRHPHVFDTIQEDNIENIKKRWHKIKMKEKNHAASDSILDSIPSSLPALMRAYRISDRAAKAGFDWDDISGVMEKVNEEFEEFKFELFKNTDKNNNKSSMEFGDILFTLVNVARFAKIHPETALTESIHKFENRFKYMEKTVNKKGVALESLTRTEMDTLWNESKKKTV